MDYESFSIVPMLFAFAGVLALFSHGMTLDKPAGTRMIACAG